MMRWLLIAAIVFIAWRLLTGRPLFPPGDDPASPGADARPSDPQPSDKGAEAMVRCKHCGIHVPARNAILEGDDWYCCPEHRDDACR